MNSTLENASKAFVGSKIARGFRWSWVLYGAAAYFGVRYMYKKGILPKQTGAALDLMDKGIDYAKSQMGFKPSEPRQSYRSGPRPEDSPVH